MPNPAPATASPAATSYGGLAHYQPYDPYHPQGHPSDPYSFPIHARSVPESAAAASAAAAAVASMEEGARKRAAEVAAAGDNSKRVRADYSGVSGTESRT